MPSIFPKDFTKDNYTGVRLDHFVYVTQINFQHLFVILDILCKISCPKNEFIVKFPNKFEKD